MTSRATWQLGRRPELDGLRGVAIVLVVVSHTASGDLDVGRYHALGSAGVTLFFVLSGFLITALLLQERADTGAVSLRSFFKRRARRLLPALLFLLAVMGIPALLLGTTWIALVAILGYGSNWYQAAGGSVFPFGHTWSLSIEEQFYLVWPAVFVLAARRRLGVYVAAAIGVVASVAITAWLLTHGASQPRIYYGTDTHALSLFAGAGLAAAAHAGAAPLRSRTLLCAALAALAGGGLLVGTNSAPSEAAWVLAASLLSVVVVWTTCCTPSPLLTLPLATYLGKRSYALYLWHVPLVYLAFGIHPGPWTALIAVLLALGMAELSWRFVESPTRGSRRGRVMGSATPGRPGNSLVASSLRTPERPVSP